MQVQMLPQILATRSAAAHLDLELGLDLAVGGHVRGRANGKGADGAVKALRQRRVLCVRRCQRELLIPAFAELCM